MSASKEYFREYRRTHPEYRKREAARVRQYWLEHPEKHRENWAAYSAKCGVSRRATMRICYAAKVMKAGKMYSPKPYMRKPDYVPVGKSGIDARSQCLACNLTDAQRAYARELAIERKERRAAR